MKLFLQDQDALHDFSGNIFVRNFSFPAFFEGRAFPAYFPLHLREINTQV